MNVAVCVPYRPGIPERDRNWAYVRAFWKQAGWPVFVGDDGGEKFSIGRSKNLAAEAAGDWDVAIFTDTDTVPRAVAQAQAAVDTAARTGMYTVAHSEILYLDEATTSAVCAGILELTRAVPVRSIGSTWINTFAITRSLWEECGGFDPRIHGYGGEDLAFYFAAGTFGGDAMRTNGPIYHLEHPDNSEENRVDGAWTVVNAYSAAKWDRAAMRAVIDSR